MRGDLQQDFGGRAMIAGIGVLKFATIIFCARKHGSSIASVAPLGNNTGNIWLAVRSSSKSLRNMRSGRSFISSTILRDCCQRAVAISRFDLLLVWHDVYQ